MKALLVMLDEVRILTSRAMQPPWPRLGVIGCRASPTTVMQPWPKSLPGLSHLQCQIVR